MLGSLQGGVPTHHTARVLLPIWFLACLFCGHGLAHLVARTAGGERRSLLVMSAAAAVLGLLARPYLLPFESTAERQLELAAGSEAKRRRVPQLAIDTPDYGYLAVQAGFGSALRSAALDDHDPRKPRPPDPFLNEASLSQALGARGARFIVATREHAAIARARCTERWRNAGFVLLECPAGPS